MSTRDKNQAMVIIIITIKIIIIKSNLINDDISFLKTNYITKSIVLIAYQEIIG